MTTTSDTVSADAMIIEVNDTYAHKYPNM